MCYIQEDVLNTIYYYKHNLEYAEVMKELKERRVQCRFNITLDMAEKMMYLNHHGKLVRCVNIDLIDVVAKEILNIIKLKKN